MWQKTGKKVTAHTLLRDVEMKVVEQDLDFKQALFSEASIMQHLSVEEIEEVTNPETYLGDALEQISAIVEYVRSRRIEMPAH